MEFPIIKEIKEKITVKKESPSTLDYYECPINMVFIECEYQYKHKIAYVETRYGIKNVMWVTPYEIENNSKN